MKTSFRCLLLSCLFIVPGCATLVRGSVGNPYLWEATKGNNKVYILGTIHKFVSLGELPGFIEQKILESELVLAEDNFWSKKKVTSQSFNSPQGKTLPEILDKKEWKLIKEIVYNSPKLKEALVKKGSFALKGQSIVLALWALDEFYKECFDKLNDDILSRKFEITLTVRDLYDEYLMKIDKDARMDKEVVAIASKARITLDYLDKDQQILSLLDKKLSVHLLKSTLARIHELGLVEDYRNILLSFYEQLEDSIQLVDRYRAGTPISKNTFRPIDLDSLLLEKRNKVWVQTISHQETAYDKFFVAGGAAHMFGKNNFLQLLKKRGYQIRRIKQ